MNLEQFDTSDAPKSDDKLLFVAPASTELPDDGVLQYVAVESVYDFAKLNDRSVAVVSGPALEALKCVAENTKLFKVRLIVLSGLPGSEYTADFDNATWNLERASYVSLINDVKTEMEIQAQIAAQNVSQHDRERAQFTRNDGTVKAFSDFIVATGDADA